MSGVTFVSLVLVAIVVRGMRVSYLHLQGSPTNSYILPLFSLCFGYVSLNVVFLFFSEGGVLNYREL